MLESDVREFFEESSLLFDDDGLDVVALVEGLSLFGCKEFSFAGASVSPRSNEDTYIFRIDGTAYKLEINWKKGKVKVS